MVMYVLSHVFGFDVVENDFQARDYVDGPRRGERMR
jgi:hypothetical protein